MYEMIKTMKGRAMNRPEGKKMKRSGFTILELLTVIGIIAMLVAILVPGIQKVKNMARDVAQKAALHDIEVGIEAFRKDYDDFPESNARGSLPNQVVCGAQVLAEAMIGRNGQGFDPLTTWDPVYEMNAGGVLFHTKMYPTISGSSPYEVTAADIYASQAKGSNADQIALARDRQRRAYIGMGDLGAYTMEELYGAGSTGDVFPSTDAYLSPVLTDVYRHKKIEVGGESIRAGMPILYYKADDRTDEFMTSSNFDKDDPTANVMWMMYRSWVYNYDDNQAICDLEPKLDAASQEKHVWDPEYQDSSKFNGQPDQGMKEFYESIRNKKVNKFNLPYNPDRYLLVSAGVDGIYGTQDDITNFDY